MKTKLEVPNYFKVTPDYIVFLIFYRRCRSKILPNGLLSSIRGFHANPYSQESRRLGVGRGRFPASCCGGRSQSGDFLMHIRFRKGNFRERNQHAKEQGVLQNDGWGSKGELPIIIVTQKSRLERRFWATVWLLESTFCSQRIKNKGWRLRNSYLESYSLNVPHQRVEYSDVVFFEMWIIDSDSPS